MNFIVYVIYSASLDRFYVGFTGDSIDSRLNKHNSNHRGFTGKNSDWVLKYKEMFTSKEDAMKREKEIKAWKSRQKIQLLISTE